MPHWSTGEAALRAVLAAVLLAFVILLFASCSAPVKSGADTTDAITDAIDGDTLFVSPRVHGHGTVRLIGIDTPETRAPGESTEPLGPEASSSTEAAAEGERVALEPGVEENDKYGRLVAYATPTTGPLAGKMLEEELLRRGLAQAYPYPPNTKYSARFALAQRGAREAGRSIWGLSQSEQCELADRGNGIGEGSTGVGWSPYRPTVAEATAGPEAREISTARTSPPRRRRKEFSTTIAQIPTVWTENPKTASPARTCPTDDRRRSIETSP